MTPPIPVAFPDFIYAGDTVKAYRSFPNYPASGAGTSYAASLAGPSATVTVSGVADGDRWLVTFTAAQTAGLVAGTYRLLERVTVSSEVFTVGNGAIQLRPNLAAAGTGVGQTHEEKTLAVIEAALSGRLTSDVQEYQIAGRAVKKIPISDLMALRSQYAAIVRQQRTGELTRKIAVEFGNPETAPDMLGVPGLPPWR